MDGTIIGKVNAWKGQKRTEIMPCWGGSGWGSGLRDMSRLAGMSYWKVMHTLDSNTLEYSIWPARGDRN